MRDGGGCMHNARVHRVKGHQAWFAVGLLLPSWLARAETDLVVQQEVHRQRVQSEFQSLEEARAGLVGPGLGVQGHLFLLRRPLFRIEFDEETAWPTWRGVRVPQDSARHPVGAVPPLRLAVGGWGSSLNLQVGSIDVTMGNGTLVERYLNNPPPGGGWNALGVVLGVEAGGLGAQVMTGNLLEPGRFLALNVHGRPALWLGGGPTNVLPVMGVGWDPWTLLLRSFSVGVTAAVDTDPNRAIRRYVKEFGQGVWRLPSPLPGTTAGLSLETQWGLQHRFLSARVLGDVTALSRTFEHQTDESNVPRTTSLLGAGLGVGGEFDLNLWIITLGLTAHYGLYGPNYLPVYFNRYHEADRLALDGTPKIAVQTPLRHGYRLQLGGQVLRTLGAFVELSDARPWEPGAESDEATLRVGGVLHLFKTLSVMGAYVNRGFGDYSRMLYPGSTSMWLGEARLQVLVLALVGRAWRTYQENGKRLEPRDGASMVVEFQIGL